MVHHVYTAASCEAGWAVEHIGKVLNVYPTLAEAEAACERLARLTQVSGHDAEVIVRDESGAVTFDELYPRADRPSA